VLSFLQRTNITDTELGLEHVEMLLNVLVYDGLIERLPAFRVGASFLDNGREDDSDEDGELRNRSRTKPHKSEEQESSDEERRAPKKKRKRAASPNVDEDEESEVTKPKKKRSKNRGRVSEVEDEDEDEEKRKSKKRKQKRKHRGSSIVDSDAESSDLDRPAKKKSKRPFKTDPEQELFTLAELTEGSAVVYRALFETQSTIGLGWSEAPCAKCPQFDFCDGGTGLMGKGTIDLEEGPVNPRNCVYFDTWSNQAAVTS
jgi:DNA-directed RNA polymerase III subunit RPC6